MRIHASYKHPVLLHHSESYHTGLLRPYSIADEREMYQG